MNKGVNKITNKQTSKIGKAIKKMKYFAASLSINNLYLT